MTEVVWHEKNLIGRVRNGLMAEIDGQPIGVWPEGLKSYSARLILNGHPLVISNHRNLERAKRAAIDYAINRAVAHAAENVVGKRVVP